MTTTEYHVQDDATAERIHLHVTDRGWVAQWTNDQAWTHLRVTHEQGETTRVNQAVLAVDPYATACNCDLETIGDELAAARDALTQREHEVGQREALADARLRQAAGRQYDVDEVVAVAEDRDDRAEARDSDAERRDQKANLEDFIHTNEDPRQLRERQRAGGDRLSSKADRAASAVDRSALTDSKPDTAGNRLDSTTPAGDDGDDEDPVTRS